MQRLLIIGGIVSFTVLTLLVLPALHGLVHGLRRRPGSMTGFVWG